MEISRKQNKDFSISAAKQQNPKATSFKQLGEKEKIQVIQRFLDGLTIVKTTGKDLEVVAKINAIHRAFFKPSIDSQSEIKQSEDTRAYFVYLNLNTKRVSLQLQEVTPYNADPAKLKVKL